jgi:cytochrome c5
MRRRVADQRDSSSPAGAALWNIGCIHCHNTCGAPQVSNVADLRARAARG